MWLLEAFFSNTSMASGAHFRSFPKLCNRLRHVTVLTTVNCWLFTWQFVTSGASWKAGIFTSLQIIRPSLSSRPKRHSPRQVRQLDFISQFTTDLCHVHGSDNPAADALSHLGTNALHIEQLSPVIDFRELAVSQVNDPDLAKLRTDSSLHLESPL